MYQSDKIYVNRIDVKCVQYQLIIIIIIKGMILLEAFAQFKNLKFNSIKVSDDEL